MPYLTAFVPESAKPAAEAATPAACYARCTAAGCLMQELAALLYKEGNVPFDQILFPYADALLLSQHKPAYWGDCLCARIPQPLADRLPALLEERFRPILPIRWEIAPSREERPVRTGLLEGEAHGYSLYIKEWADPLFAPDGSLASARAVLFCWNFPVPAGRGSVLVLTGRSAAALGSSFPSARWRRGSRKRKARF